MAQLSVQGCWPEPWQPVVDAFASNFDDQGEEGAALAIYRAGEPVLSIWAGEAAPDRAWEESTRTNLFSASKGLVALSVLQQVEAGELSLDRPVSDYWPEFGQNGKGDISLRQVLCHRSGVSALQQRVPDEAIFDWEQMTDRIAQAEPWWQPGEAQGYSPFLFGWVLGEVVRRAGSVESFGAYVEKQVAQPLGLSLGFGRALSTAALAQMRPLKRALGNSSSGADSQSLGQIMKADPRGVTNRAFSNPMTLMTASNSEAWRQAEIPAANGHSSARDLATVYGALANGGAAQGVSLLRPEGAALCANELSFESDQVLGLPLRFGHGFMLSQKRRDCRFGRGRGAFGHPGAGGCLGFADPEYGIGFGYVSGRMGQSLLIDPRPQRLIDALYECLGENP